MRACLVSHGNILAFGNGIVHSLRSLRNSLESSREERRSPRKASGTVMRARTTAEDPTETAGVHSCRKNTASSSLFKQTAMSANVQQSVCSWRSPKYRRTPAPSAQVARSVNIVAQRPLIHTKHRKKTGRKGREGHWRPRETARSLSLRLLLQRRSKSLLRHVHVDLTRTKPDSACLCKPVPSRRRLTSILRSIAGLTKDSWSLWMRTLHDVGSSWG